MMPSDPQADPGSPSPRHNFILGALPDTEFARLAPDLQPVLLPRPTELEAPDTEIKFVYFPTSGIASIIAIGANGESVDTTMIGREGMTGLPVFLGTNQMPVRTIVQIPLAGYRLPSDAVRAELQRGARAM